MHFKILVLLLLVVVGNVYLAENAKIKQTEIMWGVPGGPTFNTLIRKLMCPPAHRRIRGRCRRVYSF